MNELLEMTNRFVKKSSWKMLALDETCLCAFGTMIGMTVPEEKRKLALCIALPIFLMTYTLLIMDVVRFLTGKEKR